MNSRPNASGLYICVKFQCFSSHNCDFTLKIFVHRDFALRLGEAFGHDILRVFQGLSPECFAPTGLTGFWAIDLFWGIFLRECGVSIALFDLIIFVIMPFQGIFYYIFSDIIISSFIADNFFIITLLPYRTIILS